VTVMVNVVKTVRVEAVLETRGEVVVVVVVV
jgi:hypothetical protein